MQLVTRLPEEWHYVGLISLEHANANFPNELHNYQKFLHHCRCVFSHSSLYFFPPQNFSLLAPKPFNFYLFHPSTPQALPPAPPNTSPVSLILLLISPFSHLSASPRSPLKSILPPVVALILHPAVFSLSLYLPPPRYLPHLALIS